MAPASATVEGVRAGAMAPPPIVERIHDVNERYHDVAAAEYDAKWGIDFGELGRGQVLGKLEKTLGAPATGAFPRALEIGSGTGYFALNLLRAGAIGEATCTDLSPGMLAALARNARELGLPVRTRVAEATALPFPPASFDLVVGHAVLHHLPNLDSAFAEFRRVLAPGGIVAFAGEPSRRGDRLAAVPKRLAGWTAPAWRRLVGAPPLAAGHASGGGRALADHALEHVVDVHAFTSASLAGPARRAGFEEVRVRGEELLANWFGWFNRGLEATAEPDGIPALWRRYAYHGYLLLQRADRRWLEPRLPAEIFYNLMLSGRAPRSAS